MMTRRKHTTIGMAVVPCAVTLMMTMMMVCIHTNTVAVVHVHAADVPDECISCEDLGFTCELVTPIAPVVDEPVEEFDIDGDVTVGENNPLNSSSVYTPESLRGVRSISGNLIIKGRRFNKEFENLDFLSSLVEVGGRLLINSNKYLESLDGLSSLKNVGELIITFNQNLGNIEGLASLETVGGDVYIASNTMLETLAGLNSLTSIDGNLEIRDNLSLDSLEGLDNLVDGVDEVKINFNKSLKNLRGPPLLKKVGRLEIYYNPSLEYLDGLESLTTVECDLVIRRNASLRSIDLSSLADIGDYDGYCDYRDLHLLDNPSLESLDGLSSLEVVGEPCDVTPEELLTDAPENVRTACGLTEE